MSNPGEELVADSATRLIERPHPSSRLARVTALHRGGPFFWADRGDYLRNQLSGLIDAGLLLPRYDLVWAHSAAVARAPMEAIDARSRVLDIDNIAGAEVLSFARRLPRLSPLRLYRHAHAAMCAREERRRANLYDCVVVPSALERERLGSVSAPVKVVPNTLEPPWKVCHPDEAGRRVLFVGSLDYEPNVDALAFFFSEIAPALRAAVADVEVVVAGRNPVPRVRELCSDSGTRLINLLSIPPTPDPPTAQARALGRLYHESRVVIAPLRLGGGTRFKVIEAMATGSAIVATPTAAEGLDLEDEKHAFLATDAPTFAGRCAQLLHDPGLARCLGEHAHQAWSERYHPQVAVREVVALVDSLSPAPGLVTPH